MTDYTKMNAAKLLSVVRDDAGKWAEAFMQCNPEVKVSWGLMQSWFANAIEHSHDVRNGRNRKPMLLIREVPEPDYDGKALKEISARTVKRDIEMMREATAKTPDKAE